MALTGSPNEAGTVESVETRDSIWVPDRNSSADTYIIFFFGGDMF